MTEVDTTLEGVVEQEKEEPNNGFKRRTRDRISKAREKMESHVVEGGAGFLAGIFGRAADRLADEEKDSLITRIVSAAVSRTARDKKARDKIVERVMEETEKFGADELVSEIRRVREEIQSTVGSSPQEVLTNVAEALDPDEMGAYGMIRESLIKPGDNRLVRIGKTFAARALHLGTRIAVFPAAFAAEKLDVGSRSEVQGKLERIFVGGVRSVLSRGAAEEGEGGIFGGLVDKLSSLVPPAWTEGLGGEVAVEADAA